MSLSYLRHFLRVQKPTGLARAYQPLRCTVQRRFSTTATSTVTANHETFSSFSEPPPEEFSQYYSHNPVDEWRRMVPKQYWNNVDNTLIQRQLEKERNAVNEAVERYHQMMEDVTQLGKGANLRPAEMVIMEWFRGSLCDAIAKEQREIRNGTSATPNSHAYGIFLLQLKPEQLAVIAMHTVVGMILHHPEGVNFTQAAIEVGRNCQAEVFYRQMKSLHALPKNKKLVTVNEVNKHAKFCLEDGNWTKNIQIFVGSTLCSFLLDHTPIWDITEEGGEERVNAIYHDYVRNKGKQVGVLKAREGLFRTIAEGHDIRSTVHARLLPMLVPPRPWNTYNDGGYLAPEHRSVVMRTKGIRAHVDQLRSVSPVDIREVLDGLNALSSTPWNINRQVYEAVKSAWEAGGGIADLPPRTDVAVEEEVPFPTDGTGAQKQEWFRLHHHPRQKTIQHNRDLHSLRCDTVLKLGVAEEFLDETFYFPHNMDFRGRTYPIPPHLNHLGSDMSRGLLIFREGRALGPHGLDWLKIHMANLYGHDKIPFESRKAFTEGELDNIIDSARNPLNGNRWWLKAENPWQCLATCMELDKALSHPNPEEFISHLPVHQDGTCNGLQHYAALGKDIPGAREVNLLPSDAPQDVYRGVAVVVARLIEADAKEGDQLALALLGKIDRRIIKQTVMTSVYGVTFVGARQQIENALKDREIPIPDDQLYKASMYIARLTFASLGEIFQGARAIMDWLAKCAHVVADAGKPVQWRTPLGLPIVQPYKKKDGAREYVRTLVQTVCLVPTRDDLPVSVSRQRSAFPPNFVHSLDSSHMLKTALGMAEQKLTFASVHDSFWTHAGTVDLMNEILRKQFVELHTRPILEELLESLEKTYPDLKFPKLPERGDLDVREVLNSKYFFN